MNTLLHWLTSPEWALVVKALLHSLWQGALIAMALALVLRRVASPAARYRLALGGLGVVLLSAMLTWGVLNAPKTPNAAIIPAPAAMIAMPAVPTGPVQKIVVAANRTAAQPQMQWTAWLALVWLIGAGVMLGHASVKVAGADQLRRSCQPLNDSRIADLVADARRAVKLTRQVRVVVTQQLTSPAVVGVLLPTLILPLSLITTLSLEQIRFVLLHELAHIRRGDYLTNLFQLFAEALLFFNPAVWWLSHQIRREREACCDALAIELSGAPADYARTLVSVAETMLQPSPAAAPAFGNNREPSSLSDRVHRVLVPGYRPSLRLTWRAMLAALVLGGALLTLSAVGTRVTVAVAATLVTPQQPVELDEKQKVIEEASIAFKASPYIRTKQAVILFPMVTNGMHRLNVEHLLGQPSGGDTNHCFYTIFYSQSWNLDYKDDLVIASQGGSFYPSPTASSAANHTNFEPTVVSTNNVADLPATISPATGLPEGGGTNLVTRTFRVDTNKFAQALGMVGPVASTNLVEAWRSFVIPLGVDWQPSKTVFYKDRTGVIFVRATSQDLAAIEQALQVMDANSLQVNIRALFFEVPAGDSVYLGSMTPATGATSSAPGPASGVVGAAGNRLTGILTATQFEEVVKALKSNPAARMLAAPEIITLSGRQAQLQIMDNGTLVTGSNAMSLSTVLTLDVIPYLSADGHTIQMSLIPSITEFLGYDVPTNSASDFTGGLFWGARMPLPHYRIRQIPTSTTVWDGQTLVIGGIQPDELSKRADKVPVLGDLPFHSRTFGSGTNTNESRMNLLIFITPTIIDPAGNRVNTRADGIDQP